jgi:hypothetical protein
MNKNLDKNAVAMRPLHDTANADRNYWLSRTIVERSEALEFLREQYIAMTYETPRPEFQRICRIVERKRG